MRPALRYWLSRPPAERVAAVEYLRRQKENRSKHLGERRWNKLARTTSIPMFDGFPLGVGSWELTCRRLREYRLVNHPRAVGPDRHQEDLVRPHLVVRDLVDPLGQDRVEVGAKRQRERHPAFRCGRASRLA